MKTHLNKNLKEKIVFDLDGTLVYKNGCSLKKGIRPLLEHLKKQHDLILWTHSPKKRADHILQKYKLKKYFKDKIYREDYANMDYRGTNAPKDITLMGSGLLVDDNDVQQSYMIPGSRQISIESLKKIVKKVGKNEE